MNCVVIDDEELPRKILLQLIHLEPALNLLETFENPIDALKFINSGENEADLIFLDILMPNFTGFDFINAIKLNPQIILVSSEKNFAIKAFEYSNITDYLLKPVKKDRFKKAITKTLETANNRNNIHNQGKGKTLLANELYINSDKRLIKINIPDIEIVEAKGNFIHIKTSSGNFITYSSLKNIEAKLPSFFIRVHRSFLINFKKIIDIQDNSILINKELVPLSRRYKTQLIDRLNLL